MKGGPRPHWPDAPATRMEFWGDRVVRAFVERPPNLHAMLAHVFDRFPDREAVIDGETRLTFRELGRRADRIAAAMRGLGVAPGDRVMIVVANRWHFIALLVAAIRLGAIAVPLNVRASASEIEHIARDSGTTLLFAEGSLIEAGLVDPGGVADAALVAVDAVEEWVDGTGALPDVAEPAREEHDIAVILYTSGTTGRPKGAMLTHANIVHSCLHYTHAFAVSEEDRVSLVVPASHVTGLVAVILAPLSAGAAVICARRFDAQGFVEDAEREGLTLTVLVPAMYNLLLLRTDMRGRDLSRWRIGAFGGAPMPVATMERLGEVLPDLTLVQAYGSTETASPATIMPLGRQRDALPSVGAPVVCADIRVMDEGGREVETGAPGEIWIGGPMVVPGYWQDPERTAESFPAGYWRSGDVGRFDADGLLHIHDRIKDVINRGGYKVWSAEVENALCFHDGVAEAAVVPREDPVLGEKTHAVVVLAAGPLAEDDLRAHCARHLADYKVPDTFRLTTEPLPRNANGKVVKAGLGEP